MPATSKDEMTYSDSAPLAGLNLAEAREFFGTLISEHMAQITKSNTTLPVSDALDLDGAVAYLHEKGCIIAKRTVYNFTHTGKIPCSRLGKRLVFSRKALSEWVEQNTTTKAGISETALVVAKSAARKR